MYTFILTTTADPQRPGLTYKIQLPLSAAEAWHAENTVLKGQRHANYAYPRKDANTVITVIDPNGIITTEPYTLTWMEVAELLRRADYDYNVEYDRRQGRPEKRVLVMVTSKDRRTGAATARAGY